VLPAWPCLPRGAGKCSQAPAGCWGLPSAPAPSLAIFGCVPGRPRAGPPRCRWGRLFWARGAVRGAVPGLRCCLRPQHRSSAGREAGLRCCGRRRGGVHPFRVTVQRCATGAKHQCRGKARMQRGQSTMEQGQSTNATGTLRRATGTKPPALRAKIPRWGQGMAALPVPLQPRTDGRKGAKQVRRDEKGVFSASLAGTCLPSDTHTVPTAGPRSCRARATPVRAGSSPTAGLPLPAKPEGDGPLAISGTPSATRGPASLPLS